jgi:hypothetical protein
MGYFDTKQIPISTIIRKETFINGATILIPEGASLTFTAIDIYGRTKLGVIIPAAIDGSVMSFAVGTALDDEQPAPLTVDGEEYVIPITAGKAFALDERIIAPWQYLFLRTGTADNPTAQTAQRIITVCMKAYGVKL